jgi:hypothetical protein
MEQGVPTPRDIEEGNAGVWEDLEDYIGVPVPFAETTDRDIQQHLEERERQRFQEYVRFQEQNQPAPLTPRPSQAEINAAAASSIGDMAAKRAHDRLQTSAYDEMRAQRQFVKEMDISDPIVQEKIPICRRLNSYRRAYKGKIHFTFKQDYNPADPRLTLPMLQAWDEQVQLCLNTRGIPKMINGGIVILAGLLEKATVLYDPLVNAYGLQNNVKKAIDEGEFAEEVEQLSIELQEYFAMGPKWRLINKLADKTVQAYANNSTPVTLPNSNARAVFEANKDL